MPCLAVPRGTISCSVLLVAQTDRKSVEIALAMKEVFEGAIMLHLYPRLVRARSGETVG